MGPDEFFVVYQLPKMGEHPLVSQRENGDCVWSKEDLNGTIPTLIEAGG